ncbi:hypothetical protein HJ588_08500 [Flexivirga sp. ID2601S]|uniref:Uncharacterized protein n=1 Tax=Flexivirga aerilata TaxID=1656889 RepID=A0A849AHB5_9MICO|nr:hypothetical protein [Flexivirga aerilata]NNG39313.1 hypothetical protein [Flexivirga aerilata]
MSMKTARYAAIPSALTLVLITGCNSGSGSSAASSQPAAGGSSTAMASSAPASGAAGGSAGASTGGSAGASASAASADQCPTSNTRSFAKTRFVTDLGLAAGTFHRWLYKPYQAGQFKKGANGRIKAGIKAAAITALDIKLLDNAKKNAQANPTLCKHLYQPISNAVDKLGNLKGEITSGNLTSAVATNGILGSILSTAKQNGLNVTETTDQSKAS